MKQLPPCAIPPESPPVDAESSLRRKQVSFVREYVKDWNATQAAIRAGYSEASAGVIGCENLLKPNIKAAIERRQSEIAALAEVDAALVVRELYDIATADPRELVSVYRDSCRYCHGIDHQYQWTPAEYAAAFDKAMKEAKAAPELQGGIGYKAALDPHADCPECQGRGVETLVVSDTRKLTGKAAKLYAGAQQTKDGVRSLARDQNAALMALGRYLGMFSDRVQLSGPGGGPLQVQAAMIVQEMSMEQLMAIAAQGAPKTIEG